MPAKVSNLTIQVTNGTWTGVSGAIEVAPGKTATINLTTEERNQLQRHGAGSTGDALDPRSSVPGSFAACKTPRLENFLLGSEREWSKMAHLRSFTYIPSSRVW